jgi:hypothetical protein
MARALDDRGANRSGWRLASAAAAAVFGVATLVSGGRVLFGAGATGAGAYVPFVVTFNFAAGFAYVAAAAGLALGRRWSAGLAAAIAGATVLVFAAFGVHVAMGGAYEPRTVAAMALRSVFWVALAAFAPRWLDVRR